MRPEPVTDSQPVSSLSGLNDPYASEVPSGRFLPAGRPLYPARGAQSQAAVAGKLQVSLFKENL